MASCSLAKGAGNRHGLPALILITDRTRLPDPTPAVRRLPRGSAVIVRDYGWPGRRALALRLARLCRARGLRLLVAGDARLARATGAGGLHLPERQVAAASHAWRLWRPPGFLVTAAAHHPRAIALAARFGADAVLVSPVFATASHPAAPTLGVLRFARLLRQTPLPAYALGGITPANARRLAGTGAAGLAGISGVAGIAAPRLWRATRLSGRRFGAATSGR
jgi:thiamine-phosphate pyrophosphorylase